MYDLYIFISCPTIQPKPHDLDTDFDDLNLNAYNRYGYDRVGIISYFTNSAFMCAASAVFARFPFKNHFLCPFNEIGRVAKYSDNNGETCYGTSTHEPSVLEWD